ncbi:MAG: DUF1566 domain-containing protein [Planctomycetota bacterium]|nr:DUF1566 domain-containing protein [Planctomycetota bacterium]
MVSRSLLLFVLSLAMLPGFSFGDEGGGFGGGRGSGFGGGGGRFGGGSPAISIDILGGSGGGLTVNATDGWEFSVEVPLTVTALGVWDHKLDGLGTDIPVGLWDDKGQLLGTATVPAGTVVKETDGFRYVPIQPIQLQAKRSYVIGAAYTPETKENVIGGVTATKFFSDGSIRWVKRRRVIRKDGLTFPEPQAHSVPIGLDPGGFGPNFLIAKKTTPRIYYRTHKVGEPHDYVMMKVPEDANGSHKRDPVVFVSLFAKKSGELTQIVVNGEPLGTGPDTLRMIRSTVSTISAGYKEMTGVQPNVRISAPTWARYADIVDVIDVCRTIEVNINPRTERGGPQGRSTVPATLEFSTPKDTRLPLVIADVDSRFIERDECVEDTWTGLLWQKDGSAGGKKNYQQATDYAAKLQLNGLTGWRVPTIEELATVFPADDAPFTRTPYTTKQCCAPPDEFASYWTSERAEGEDRAYLYHWYAAGGSNGVYASRNFVNVRCVRDVTPASAVTLTIATTVVPGSNSATTGVGSLPTTRAASPRTEIRRVTPVVSPPATSTSSSSRVSLPADNSQRGQIVAFLRNHVIGRTVVGRVITTMDLGRLESDFERRTTFTRLIESANGFGFDEVIQIRETIRPRGKERESAAVRRDNRRVFLRHQYSVRQSTGEIVGYAREVSHDEGQLSEAAVINRAVAQFQNGELIIRTSTVGYDDHITADGLSPSAVRTQSRFSVSGDRLQRSQANEFFSVNADTLSQKPNRREVELIVETQTP